MTANEAQQRRIRRTTAACVGLVMGMTGLAFASVPLYDLFCRMTGFDGTPRISQGATAAAIDRTMTIRFDANVMPGLNWRFAPEASAVDVKVGETKTVLYTVKNDGPSASTGMATFNVQPAIAGAYFNKVQCFCFTENTLQGGEAQESAVVFYVDPAIADDPNLANVHTITLSYTYFPAKGAKPVATSSVVPQAKP